MRLILALLLALAATNVHAQVTTGSILGTVRDTSGGGSSDRMQ